MPRKLSDLTDHRIGNSFVLCSLGTQGKDRIWLCACLCQAETLRALSTSQLSKLKHCPACSPHERHGASKTPEFIAFRNAIARCRKPGHPDFPRYGARGITFEFESFEHFIHEVGLRPSSKHTLDRLDNSKGYRPGNVDWRTREQQTFNRRRRSDNSTGYIGVYRRANGTYVADGQFGGVHHFLGHFEDPVSAARAYDDAVLRYRGENATLNFPK